jgi:hypothetical protein
MLKFTKLPLHQAPGKAEIVPGVEGLPAKVIVLAVLLPGEHALVLAVTDKGPEVNVDAMFSRIVVLPWPVAMVVPAGLVQV